MFTDGEFEEVWRVEAHAVAVGSSQHSASEVSEGAIIGRHLVQEHVIVAHQLNRDITYTRAILLYTNETFASVRY